MNGVPDISDTGKAIALLESPEIRADFGLKMRAFLESLDMVLPRAEALPYVPDARRLGFLQRVAANVYRDSTVPLVGIGRKVRDLIDRHIIAQGVAPTGPPVSVLASDFDVQTRNYDSPRTQASAMEHALRHHIRDAAIQDPVFYRRLSDRLEEALQRLHDKPEELVAALRELIDKARQGRERTGPDTGQSAIFDILLEERARASGVALEDIADSQCSRLDALARELVLMLATKTRQPDFWRSTTRRPDLEKELYQILDEPLFGSEETFVYDRLDYLANLIMQIARARYTTLSQISLESLALQPTIEMP